MDPYIIFPNQQRPKYIFPMTNRKVGEASLNLYIPLTFVRKIQVLFFKLLLKIGIVKYLFTKTYDINTFVSDINLKHLEQWLIELLKQKNLKYAIYTGAPGFYQKTTIQIMTKDGVILGYAKIANTDQTIRQLLNEKVILEYLQSLDISSAQLPQILGYNENNNQSILVQSPPPQDFIPGNFYLTNKHIVFLVEILKKTEIRQKFSDSYCFGEIIKRFRNIDKWCNHNMLIRLKDALGRLTTDIGHIAFPMAICHYDFKPWNIRVHRKIGQLYIFDWELAQKNWMPLWDIFHYIIQPSILVKKIKPLRIFNYLIKPNDYYEKLFKIYMTEINLSPTYYQHLLLFYLLDVMSFYLVKQHAASTKDVGEDFYIDSLFKILNLCSSNLYKPTTFNS